MLTHGSLASSYIQITVCLLLIFVETALEFLHFDKRFRISKPVAHYLCRANQRRARVDANIVTCPMCFGVVMANVVFEVELCFLIFRFKGMVSVLYSAVSD